jgi:LmbE family N-acetylglucosaminyl deacetylase
MKYFLLLSLLLSGYHSFLQTTTKKTIVFIGAHPDDEMALSEVLVKYAGQGHTVYVISATDGINGTRVTNIPAGDSLGQIRKKEAICSAQELGIRPPVFFSIERLDTKIGVRNYYNCHRQLMDSLRSRIPAMNPDLIISFGPDGDTHHAEHIVVGSAITELLLAEGWVNRYPLYYVGWKKGTEPAGVEDYLSYVDSQYFNVQVDYGSLEKEKAIRAMYCYKSQFTEAEMKEEADRKRKETENRIYFRKLVTAPGMQKEF